MYEESAHETERLVMTFAECAGTVRRPIGRLFASAVVMHPDAKRLNDWSERIIGAAIDVHRALGPGLLEAPYEQCLCHELEKRALKFERQKPLQLV